MNIKKSILFFILCAQSLLIHGQDKTSVLFLVSYDSSFPTFSLQYRGLIEGFEERNKEIDLHIEFLDSKRFPFDQVKTGLYDSLRNKNASGNSYEYVITADDNALKFVDACILDLTLPGDMSGQDVATRIREISPKTILIASSGYAESPVIAYPKKFGFNDSITKPFNLDELAVILEENLLPSD